MADFQKSATESPQSEIVVCRWQMWWIRKYAVATLGYASQGENLGRGTPKAVYLACNFSFFPLATGQADTDYLNKGQYLFINGR